MQPLGGGPLGEQALEHARWDPAHAAVFADLDPELHRLPLGRPAGILGNDGWATVPVALSCSEVRSDETHAPRGGLGEPIDGKSARCHRRRVIEEAWHAADAPPRHAAATQRGAPSADRIAPRRRPPGDRR
jgi:hypothetical protein